MKSLGNLNIVEGLRDTVRLLIQEKDGLQAKLTACEARVRELEHRLEIDTAYGMDGKEIVIPTDKRDEMPDGIECRDETIKLQDEAIEKLKARLTGAQRVMATYGKHHKTCSSMRLPENYSHDCNCGFEQALAATDAGKE